MKNIWLSIVKPKGPIAQWLVFISLIAIFILGAQGYFESLKALTDTDQLSLKVGEHHITLYKVLESVLVIILTFWTAAIISDLAERRISKLKKMRAANRALISKFAHIIVYFAFFLFGLNTLGIDLTTLTIFSGALGIGLGFGLQKIASNFISGIILLMEKSVEQDDLIEMSDGTTGFIRKSNARFTLVETLDGKEIMIPNEDFITNRVINWTYSNTKGRVQIMINVSYDSDIVKARDLILEAAREHPRCVTLPEPSCFLRGFGDSSVNFLLHFWVADVRDGRWNAESDVLFSIWQKFADNDIEIPYPQQDLHLKNPEMLKFFNQEQGPKKEIAKDPVKNKGTSNAKSSTDSPSK